MAPDPRLSAALGTLREHLQADAEVTRAANAEPSDDAYIAIRDAATAYYLPGSGLEPISGRFAIAGNVRAAEELLPADDIAPAPVFAVALVPDGVVALVGSMRDPNGTVIAEALLLTESGSSWRVAGRAGRDHSAPKLDFIGTGGASVDVDAASGAELIGSPAAPADKRLLEDWANDHT